MEAQRAGVFLWFSTAFDMQNTRVLGTGFRAHEGSFEWFVFWQWRCVLGVIAVLWGSWSLSCMTRIMAQWGKSSWAPMARWGKSSGRITQEHHAGLLSEWVRSSEEGKKMTKKDVMHYVHSKTKPYTNPELTWYGDWLRTGSATERSDRNCINQWHSPLRNSVQTGNTRAYQNGFTAVALSWCSYWSSLCVSWVQSTYF